MACQVVGIKPLLFLFRFFLLRSGIWPRLYLVGEVVVDEDATTVFAYNDAVVRGYINHTLRGNLVETATTRLAHNADDSKPVFVTLADALVCGQKTFLHFASEHLPRTGHLL